MIKKHLFYLSIFCISIWSCSSSKTYISNLDPDRIEVSSAYQEDASVANLIAPYKKEVTSQMIEVIGTLDKKLSKRRPNSNLGNWFADALKDEASVIYNNKVDFAVQNYGGIRIPSLAAGAITVGNIFELMPFDNKLLILTCDGATVKKLTDRIAEKGGWPISDGLSFRIVENHSEDVMIHGEPLDMSKRYVAAIPDYIANGGDNCEFLLEMNRVDTEKYVRDIVIDHLRKEFKDGTTQSVDNTKRIK